MKETQKNTTYQAPVIKVVSFLIEKGFQASRGLEKVTLDNNDGDLSNTTTGPTRWN